MISKEKIKEIVIRIATDYNPDKIILFGSYANGSPDENSDIDFLVIKDSEKSRPERGIEVRKLLSGLMIPMDILVYTNKEISESSDKKYSFVYQALTYGKTLYERE
ncbi:MAG: nucleotidyltransferase domain-containing protein [Bacteroidetes bacterium]|nr:nucleotidyltransferase domain-containing protein [Bacteroidota bacterium]